MSEKIVFELFFMLISVFEFCVFIWFYKLVSNGYRSRYAKIQLAVIAGLYFPLMYFCDTNNVLPSIKMVFLMTIIVIGMHFMYHIRFVKVLTVSLYVVLANIISEALTMGIIMSIGGQDWDNYFTADKSMVMVQASLVSKTIYIVILFILKNFLVKNKKRYSKKEFLMLLIQTVSSCTVIMISLELVVTFERKNEISPYVFSVVSIIAFVAYCVSIWITDHYFSSQHLIQENIRLEEYRKQKEQYLSIRQDAEEGVRQIYHDLRKHLNAIDKLSHANDQELDEYIQDINRILKPYEKFYDTGCEVLDMILAEKETAAEQAGIHFDTKIEEKSLSGLRTFNLNVIFTNALDNALEANQRSETMEDEEIKSRFIRVRVKKERVGISIHIQNSYHAPLQRKSGGLFRTSKSDHEMHGIGMGSIRSSVEALKGKMNVEADKGVFHLFILLPK